MPKPKRPFYPHWVYGTPGAWYLFQYRGQGMRSDSPKSTVPLIGIGAFASSINSTDRILSGFQWRPWVHTYRTRGWTEWPAGWAPASHPPSSPPSSAAHASISPPLRTKPTTQQGPTTSRSCPVTPTPPAPLPNLVTSPFFLFEQWAPPLLTTPTPNPNPVSVQLLYFRAGEVR